MEYKIKTNIDYGLCPQTQKSLVPISDFSSSLWEWFWYETIIGEFIFIFGGALLGTLLLFAGFLFGIKFILTFI